MDWASVWKDIVGGLLIAGALAAWVPESFWRAFFLVDNPTLAVIEGPLVGPLVAMLSFVCSVGNVPLAAVLWCGGISFGGVVSFILADLIVLPILDIYRKYWFCHVGVILRLSVVPRLSQAALHSPPPRVTPQNGPPPNQRRKRWTGNDASGTSGWLRL